MILGRKALINCFQSGILRCICRDGDSDKEIPYELLHIGPNSIDVTLSPCVAFLRGASYETGLAYPIIDLLNANSLQTNVFHIKDSLVLPPNGAILACTRERFIVTGKYRHQNTDYDIVQQYEGRSTFGRLYMLSHVSAGFGDVGFSSAWTLELVNLSPAAIRLYPGMRIGQVFFQLVFDADTNYSGAYCQQHSAPKPPVLGISQFVSRY